MSNFTKSETADRAAQFLAFFAAAGVEYLNLASLIPAASGEGMVMERGKRARDRAEVERSLGWAAVRNRAGANIYCRPARYLPNGALGAWPVVFLDDLAPSTAAGIAKKYRSILVETSANNLQAWIVVARPLQEHERLAVQRSLAQRLGADPRSVSGEHFGRFPGFHNRKEGRQNHRIEVWATNGDGLVLDPAPYLSDAVQPLPPRSGAVCPRNAPAGTSDAGDESAREYRYAVARLHAGRPINEVVEAVFRHALERGKHRGSERNVRQYAETTVRKAAAHARR